jgi:hypothetical protein
VSFPPVGAFDRLVRRGKQLGAISPSELPLVQVREGVICIQIVSVVFDQLLISTARAFIVLDVPLRLADQAQGRPLKTASFDLLR